MKPMLLSPADTIPKSKEWIYEAKYDGYRCLLLWDGKTPVLQSRNEKDLTHLFPEIIQFCEEIYAEIAPYLPLTFDGELVYLINDFKSEFSSVQSRGKMRNKKMILNNSKTFPCNFIAFDLIRLKGQTFTTVPLVERKEKLQQVFHSTGIPLTLQHAGKGQIQAIDVFEDADLLWDTIRLNNGEGLIAKKKTSLWTSGQRSNQWLKIKNWRYVTVIVTQYDKKNGFFNGAIYKEGSLVDITVFRHGLSEEEFQTLVVFFEANGRKTSNTTWELAPSICVDIACIDFDGKKLREPRFHAFRFEIDPEDVNWRMAQRQLHPLPETVQITHPDKPIWPAKNIVKDEYLFYLQQVSSYFLPFLHNRLLTAIRFPHGVPGESFYQKNAPDYTPSFIKTKQSEDIRFIVCNDLESLLWLGNQLVLEFHIPFQTITTDCPTEIVFDLDPPSVDEFPLAIEAALRMKAIFDHFNLQSLVKTSGGKGLQVYIPLPKDSFSYEETRIFTEFVCHFLCEQEPRWFTIERLKKNRHNKLYLDYVQHAHGKTITAPYSPRGNEQGLIATPLNWFEVNDNLKPSLFPIPAVLDRIKNVGNPFEHFYKIGEEQPFETVLNQLKDLVNERPK